MTYRRARRLRTATAWVTTVLAALFIASFFFPLNWTHGSTAPARCSQVLVSRGGVMCQSLALLPLNVPIGHRLTITVRVPAGFWWRPHASVGGGGFLLVLPLWVPLLGCIGATWALARRAPWGRPAAELCASCGYDVGGVPGGCPECGGTERLGTRAEGLASGR